MNNIKSNFTIKDLENLSGIKAHTIRIWEKRYNILEPDRTDSNIRFYDGNNLKKLLNVTYLYNEGHKISKIAKLQGDELTDAVRKEAADSKSENEFTRSLKLATVNFDFNLFEQTYNKLARQFSFRHIFLNIFIPLLEDIGLMWQSHAITPAHEHFMTKLMMQKLLVNIETAQKKLNGKSDRTFVLFLPSNEIHEFGLLYLHYELINKGFKSIYLGPSVPIEDLKGLKNLFEDVQYVSYFTIQPEQEKIKEYLKEFNEHTGNGKAPNLWISGRMAHHLDEEDIPANIERFLNIDSFLAKLDSLDAN